MALKAAQDRGRIDAARTLARLTSLRARARPDERRAGAVRPDRQSRRRACKAQDILFLGRGPMFPLALEGALKLKEISYIHAEGYASGELKHGPIALIDAAVPVIVLAPKDALFDKTVSNMQEVMARNGKVLLMSDAAGVERGRRRHLEDLDPARRSTPLWRRSSTRSRPSFWPITPPSPRAPTWTSRATWRSR